MNTSSIREIGKDVGSLTLGLATGVPTARMIGKGAQFAIDRIRDNVADFREIRDEGRSATAGFKNFAKCIGEKIAKHNPFVRGAVLSTSMVQNGMDEISHGNAVRGLKDISVGIGAGIGNSITHGGTTVVGEAIGKKIAESKENATPEVSEDVFKHADEMVVKFGGVSAAQKFADPGIATATRLDGVETMAKGVSGVVGGAASGITAGLGSIKDIADKAVDKIDGKDTVEMKLDSAAQLDKAALSMEQSMMEGPEV